MELALEKLAEHGVVGILFALTIYYFLKREKKHEKEIQLKDAIIAAKDDKIQGLNDQIRGDAIENVSLFKDVDNTLKDLVVELKIRNNGGN